jgi:two-component sensor histidine kinase
MVEPEALATLLRRLRDEYGNPPVWITENGASYEDPAPDAAGVIQDASARAYLRDHLLAASRAAAEGCDLRGYFCWTLTDNWEWAKGYTQRFGLVAVDRAAGGGACRRRAWTRSGRGPGPTGWLDGRGRLPGEGIDSGRFPTPAMRAAPPPPPPSAAEVERPPGGRAWRAVPAAAGTAAPLLNGRVGGRQPQPAGRRRVVTSIPPRRLGALRTRERHPMTEWLPDGEAPPAAPSSPRETGAAAPGGARRPRTRAAQGGRGGGRRGHRHHRPRPRPAGAAHRVRQRRLHPHDRLRAGRGGGPDAAHLQGPARPRRAGPHARGHGGGPATRGETVNYRKDGSAFTIEWLITPVLDGTGRVAHWVSAQRDVTERKRAEARQRLLLAELNHRVKNTLVAVQSVAAQTARQAETADGFRAAFQSRLMALARSHDMLTEGGWEGAALREVAQRTLAAYGGAPARFGLSGPPVRLAPAAVVTLNLAFHELATNAAKHGALSAPGGRVEVGWTLEAGDGGGDPALAISWEERGGPPVRPPESRGFGSRLIERGLPQEFGAEVSLRFAPAGVECRIRLPAAKNVLAP